MMAAFRHIAESSDTTIKKTAKRERVNVTRMRSKLEGLELEASSDDYFKNEFSIGGEILPHLCVASVGGNISQSLTDFQAGARTLSSG